MGLTGDRTFVGFGFGPIQAGLFAYEAFRSGNFRRIVVGEVLPLAVESLREEGGVFRINIAHADHVETVAVGPVEVENPLVDRDRGRLDAAVAEASEIATAVPSVRFYASDGPGSLHRVLARGLAARGGKPAVVYAAENNNRAAEILEEAVLGEVPAGLRDRVRQGTRFLDTVIGKMSAAIADPDRQAEGSLRPLNSRDPRAFLVEDFHRILISRVTFPADAGFRRGIDVFEEKDDLHPFEEAKLYGHNATHALAGYLAARRGLVRLDEIRSVPGAVDFIRAAFLEECGAALRRKWAGADPLFTEPGFREHVDDLIARMLNPHLGDLVERITRDPERKLGWDDRLVGAMRLALAQGIEPRRFALGAAAAVAGLAEGSESEEVLEGIWRPGQPDPEEAKKIAALVREALPRLRAWRSEGRLP
jgi:mannitol-1-phosphate 5-dehydrogenase